MTTGVVTTITGARRALGERLAELRKAAGYGQVKFAPLVGWSRSTLANVEVGRQHVPRQFWESCERVLPAARGLLVSAYEDIERFRRQQRQTVATAHRHPSEVGQGRQNEAVDLIHQVLQNLRFGQDAGSDMLEDAVLTPVGLTARRDTRSSPWSVGMRAAARLSLVDS